MDIYKIGSLVAAGLKMLFLGQARTGRTTAMLNALQDGDLVICSSEEEARWNRRRFQQLCVERELDITVRFVAESNIRFDFPQHREVYFTHDYIEKRYLKACESVESDMKNMAKELKANESKRRVFQIAKPVSENEMLRKRLGFIGTVKGD
ncbi:hypothetical protein D5018_03875 [Parashewanella curva]|uniref:Uncharacterized protein n=1 Tax=Parashewanella curva TaxID=2338552 RepID=A0A3L8Q0M4_9GAMM|nr:hypothetical protein [Parashewanella curva]RLV60990.1 hypothetical protein D5018_03875 [Parashewanella curva]